MVGHVFRGPSKLGTKDLLPARVTILFLLFIYIVQLYKEDWEILRMLGCRAVALPGTEQIF